MRYVVEGGRPLQGEVTVPGAKNSALHLLAATLLIDDEIVLHRVPPLKDVETLIALLEHLGKRVERVGPESYRIRFSRRLVGSPPPELVRKMRASFHVLGPLLTRVGEAEIPLPGGDAIGQRPVDLHLRGLQAMGARFELCAETVRARVERLRPAEVHLRYPSVGATEHLMMTATRVPGRTVIHNPAREPEVEDLAQFLRQLGARIELHPTHIGIEGGAPLRGTDYRVMPDRLCAGTFAIAAAVTGGKVAISCDPWHLRPLTGTLQAMNVAIEERSDGVVVAGRDPCRHRSIEIETGPYPDFPTDMHPPIMPLLALTPGESRLRETVFEDRFSYLEGLRRMGADIEIWGQTAIVRGVDGLKSVEVEEHRDNRAGVALVLAGLTAEGTTVVHDVNDHIPRGYSDLVGTLNHLGARIRAE